MSASPERLWNRSFILCLLNNLFLFVYYFALLTILPVYIMKDLGGSVKEAGLALTLFLVFWHDHRETRQEIGNARSRSYFCLIFLWLSAGR